MSPPFVLPPPDFPLPAYVRRAESGLLTQAVLPGLIVSPGLMGPNKFHPKSLDGVVGVYQISNISTLKQERTGASATTPAVVDGLVGTVLDLSGNGNHLVAPSDTARPRLRQTGSRYYLEFDGSNDTLTCANFSISNRFYLGAALEQRSTAAFFIEHSTNSNNFPGFAFMGFGGTTGTWLVKRGSSEHFGKGPAGWVGLDPAVVELVYRQSNQDYYKNGIIGSVQTASGTIQSQSTATTTLYVMSRAASSFFGAVDLYALVLVDGNISDGDVALCRQWLADQIGVTL